MDNFDSNMIKPVDSLQSIAGLAPTRRREQRKSRQQFGSNEQEHKEKQHEEEIMEHQFDESLHIVDDADDTKIDYRA